MYIKLIMIHSYVYKAVMNIITLILKIKCIVIIITLHHVNNHLDHNINIVILQH